MHRRLTHRSARVISRLQRDPTSARKTHALQECIDEVRFNRFFVEEELAVAEVVHNFERKGRRYVTTAERLVELYQLDQRDFMHYSTNAFAKKFPLNQAQADAFGA